MSVQSKEEETNGKVLHDVTLESLLVTAQSSADVPARYRCLNSYGSKHNVRLVTSPLSAPTARRVCQHSVLCMRVLTQKRLSLFHFRTLEIKPSFFTYFIFTQPCNFGCHRKTPYILDFPKINHLAIFEGFQSFFCASKSFGTLENLYLDSDHFFFQILRMQDDTKNK